MKCRHIFLIVFWVCLASETLAGPSDPALAQLKQSYESSLADSREPISDFQKRYIEELEKLSARAQSGGNLEEMMAIKEELSGFESGPGSSLAQYPGVAKLRGIYDTNIALLESEAARNHEKALNQYIAGVAKVVSALTSAGKIEEALAVNEIKSALSEELASLKSVGTDLSGGVALENSLTPSNTATSFVRDVELIPAVEGKSGRLRSFGSLRFGKEVLPEEIREVDDFVKVYAYHICWIGVRENGEVFIHYIAPNAQTIHSMEDSSIELISRGHDGWVVNRRNEFWRAAEPERVVDLKRKPDGILGSHCGGLAYWSDGSSITSGSQFTSSKRIPPPEDFLEDMIGAGSGESTMIAIDSNGTPRGWNLDNGEPVVFEGISGIVEFEVGKGHAVARMADGSIDTFSTGGKAVDWDVSTMSFPADFEGVPAKVRAGGHASAIQRANGAWVAWGPNAALNKAVSSASVAVDLDLYGTATDGYAIWIESVD